MEACRYACNNGWQADVIFDALKVLISISNRSTKMLHTKKGYTKVAFFLEMRNSF